MGKALALKLPLTIHGCCVRVFFFCTYLSLKAKNYKVLNIMTLVLCIVYEEAHNSHICSFSAKALNKIGSKNRPFLTEQFWTGVKNGSGS